MIFPSEVRLFVINLELHAISAVSWRMTPNFVARQPVSTAALDLRAEVSLEAVAPLCINQRTTAAFLR
jgi:hypothetical protein